MTTMIVSLRGRELAWAALLQQFAIGRCPSDQQHSVSLREDPTFRSAS